VFKVKTLLAVRYPDEIEYFDVKIYEGGKLWFDIGQYFTFSVRRLLECHDTALTVWRERQGQASVRRYFFDPSRVPEGVHFFRPAGREYWQVVSAEVKELPENHKFKTLTFYPFLVKAELL